MSGKMLALGLEYRLFNHDRYGVHPLPGAAAEARKVADLLAEPHIGQGLAATVQPPPNTSMDAATLHRAIADFLAKPSERAVLYFSGHAISHRGRTYLLADDFVGTDQLPAGAYDLSLLATAVNESKIPTVVILLDCCHAGSAFDDVMGAAYGSRLRDGVALLSASTRDESALATGTSVFTRILLDGLDGGAAEVMGEVTLSSLFSYVARRLGEHEQSPVLKANLSRRVVLRMAKPQLDYDDLAGLPELFEESTSCYQLSPAHDPTFGDEYDEALGDAYRRLQRLRNAGLLGADDPEGFLRKTYGEAHLYRAVEHAMTCSLTPLGRHYWTLARERRIPRY